MAALSILSAFSSSIEQLRVQVVEAQRKQNGEFAATPHLAVHPDVAAVQPDDASGKRQPNPGPAVASRYRGVCLRKALEYGAELFDCNSDSGVAHFDEDVAQVDSETNCHLTARLREFERIRKKVHDDALDLLNVAMQVRRFRIDHEIEGDLLACGEWACVLHDARDGVAQRSWHDLQVHELFRHSGEIEKVIDQLQQTNAVPPHSVDELRLTLRER